MGIIRLTRTGGRSPWAAPLRSHTRPSIPNRRTNPSEPRPGVRLRGVKLALTAVVCGVLVVSRWTGRADVHGPIVVIGFVGSVVFIAWNLTGMLDDRRAA
jgi:hypothetical protein